MESTHSKLLIKENEKTNEILMELVVELRLIRQLFEDKKKK